MLERIIVSLSFLSSSIVFALHFLRAVQGNAYRVPFGISKKDDAVILGGGAIQAAFGILLSFLSLDSGGKIAVACGTVVPLYIAGLVLYLCKRTKFKFTKRGARIFTAVLILLTGGTAASIVTGIYLFSLFLPLSLVASCLIYPVEQLNIKRYTDIAKRTFGGFKGEKIVVTGSFGKTGVKNILEAILKEQYNVVSSPKNYNTPMGMYLSSKLIKPETEVFIAEAGARRRGDIKEICNIVKPTKGIITAIGIMHLATFKRYEAIYNTKKELADCLPDGSFLILNADNAGTNKIAQEIKNRLVITASCRGGGDVNVIVKSETLQGTLCEISVFGEDFTVTTPLLGTHNAQNIALALACAKTLNVANDAAARAIAALKAPEHRMQLLDGYNGITIIDDSYNCNFEGAKEALRILNTVNDGRRKVLFTQGIIELGREQAETNAALGALAAAAADAVILTGVNAHHIEKGLRDKDFGGEIHTYKSFKLAQAALPEVLKAGDLLLIQNDLP